jgi:alkanesulfonate monooxygenase
MSAPSMAAAPGLEVFSTSPQSLDANPQTYLRRVVVLVYTDNGIVDPWLVAQNILLNTSSLMPLVAVQPIYMHPYAVAKMVTSLAFLHGRRVCLNLVAGGFKNDLTALGDPTPHDERYARLVEYVAVIRALLEGAGPLTFNGRYYRTGNLTLKPPLPPELYPEILVSGSSAAGMEAARAMGAVAVKYPEPPEEAKIEAAAEGMRFGVRVGVVARPARAEAWRIAHERFPNDRRGQLMHQLSLKVTDSEWRHRLAALGSTPSDTYWLGPFENSKTNCPYLVGAYDDVAAELAAYVKTGYRTFILDIPPDEEELSHIAVVFRKASERSVA